MSQTVPLITSHTRPRIIKSYAALHDDCPFPRQVANRFGLVALIANGYRILSYVFLAVYLLPVMTYGVSRLVSRYRRRPALPEARVEAVS
jgi:hypothetical protein